MPDPEDIVELALEMIAKGFYIFPVKPNEKIPLVAQGFKSASNDTERARTFLTNPGRPNYGMVRPPGDPVFMWDIDGGNGLASWRFVWKQLEERLGPLPRTLTTKTPSGGRHIFLRWRPEYGPPPAGNKLLGFTVRWADAGYVLGPGSSIEGRLYVTNHADIVDLPENWAKAALEQASPTIHIEIAEDSSALDLPDAVPEGERYAAIRRLVAGYYNRGIPPETIWTVVLHDLAPRFSTPLPEHELRERFERTWKGIEQSLGPPRATPEARARLSPEQQRLDDLIFDELPSGEFPDEPDPIAFKGLAGEIVGNLEGQTSASRVGLLTSVLAIAGVVLSTTTGFYGRQPSSFMACLVGDTAKGRKSTAMTVAWGAMTADDALGRQRGVRLNGLGSGEGIVGTAAKRVNADGFARLLIQEPEFGNVLTVGKREGATLSFLLRTAFDCEPLMNVTKAGAIGVEEDQYQLGMLAGITPAELRKLLGETELVNGFANRFLWVPVVGRDEEVTGRVPFLHPAMALSLAAALADAEHERHRMYELEDDAHAALRAYYKVLAASSQALAIRLATIAARIALVHASLDQDRSSISFEYVARAIALTEYSRSGFGWVFGQMVVGVDARRMLQVLLATGESMTKTALGKAALGTNRYDAGRVQDAIASLRQAGLVEIRVKPTGLAGGRPGQEVCLTVSARSVARFIAARAEPAPAPARTRETPAGPLEVEEPMKESEASPKPQSEHEQAIHNLGLNPDTNPVLTPDHSAANLAGVWRYPCRSYLEHRNEHHLVDELWECRVCAPDAASVAG